MQLQIYSLSTKEFQRLENFCNRANVNMKYELVTDDVESYDVTIASLQKQCYFSTCRKDDSIALFAFNSELYLIIDSSEFHKVVII